MMKVQETDEVEIAKKLNPKANVYSFMCHLLNYGIDNGSMPRSADPCKIDINNRLEERTSDIQIYNTNVEELFGTRNIYRSATDIYDEGNK